MKFSVGLFLVNLITISPCLSFDLSRAEGLDPRIIQNTQFEGFTERIVGGQEALDEQFPYQAGLLLQHVSNSTKWCGGCLIGRRWVLTAAHCLDSIVSVKVYLGAHNIIASNEIGRQIIDVAAGGLIIHSEYDSTASANDIGLIQLPEDARISRDIQIIALPSPSDANESFEDVTAVASGWGRSSDMASTVSPVLRYVDLKVISNYICSLTFTYRIRASSICTNGIDFKSPCNGDSGGPLVYEKNKKNILIGLTSFGSSAGCEKGWPAVFTRVTYYLNWIKSLTGIQS